MPTHLTSLAAHGISGSFSLLETLFLNLYYKSNSRTISPTGGSVASIKILSPLLVVSAGAALSSASLFVSRSRFESAIKSLLLAVSPSAVAASSGESFSVGHQFNKFSHAIANTPPLFDLLAMMTVIAVAFYVAHGMFVKRLTDNDVNANEVVDSDSSAAQKTAVGHPTVQSPKVVVVVPPPPSSTSLRWLTSPAFAAVVLLLGVALRADGATKVQQVEMLGRVVSLVGYHLLHHAIATASSGKEAGGGDTLASLTVHLHGLALASMLTSMVAERVRYEPTCLLHFFRRAPRDADDEVEMHAALVALVSFAITSYHSCRIFSFKFRGPKPSFRALLPPLLQLLLVLLLGPSGVGWVATIGSKASFVLAYSYFAYAVFFVAGVAATGAPGVIVMAGGIQLLCSYHGVEFEKLLNSSADARG